MLACHFTGGRQGQQMFNLEKISLSLYLGKFSIIPTSLSLTFQFTNCNLIISKCIF